MNVGCRGFVGQSLHQVLGLFVIYGLQRSKAIKTIFSDFGLRGVIHEIILQVLCCLEYLNMGTSSFHVAVLVRTRLRPERDKLADTRLFTNALR